MIGLSYLDMGTQQIIGLPNYDNLATATQYRIPNPFFGDALLSALDSKLGALKKGRVWRSRYYHRVQGLGPSRLGLRVLGSRFSGLRLRVCGMVSK